MPRSHERLGFCCPGVTYLTLLTTKLIRIRFLSSDIICSFERSNMSKTLWKNWREYARILTWMTNKIPLYLLKVGVWLTRWFDACCLVVNPSCCLHSCFYIFTRLVTTNSLKPNINIDFVCRFTSDLMGWRNPDAIVKMLLLQDLTGSSFF